MDSLSICPIYQITMDTARHDICLQSEFHFPYTPIPTNPHLWGEFLYTICFLIIFTFIRLKGKDFFYYISQLIFKRKKIELILNEGFISNITYYLFMLTASFSILAGCLSIYTQDHFITIHTLYYFIALLIYHFILMIIVQLLGWNFDSRNTAQEIIINLWIYHISFGLSISPFILASFYMPHFAHALLFKIVILSLGLLLIIKFIRWIEILYAHKVSIFYMILYLCALEIIPLLFLYKVVL